MYEEIPSQYSYADTYYDIFRNGKMLKSNRGRYQVFIFPSGKSIAYTIKPDRAGIPYMNYFLEIPMNGDTLRKPLTNIGSALTIAEKNKYYRVQYIETLQNPVEEYSDNYTYRNFILTDLSGHFDTLNVNTGNGILSHYGNLYVTQTDSLLILQDFKGTTILTSTFQNEMPVEMLNKNRMLVGNLPFKYLMDADGRIIIDSLEEAFVLNMPLDPQNQVGFIVGLKKGKYGLFDLNGARIMTLQSKNVEIVAENPNLVNGLYVLKSEKDILPFNYRQAVVAPLIPEKVDYFKSISTNNGLGKLYGIGSSTYSCIMTPTRKVVHTFKPNEKLYLLNADSTCVVYDETNKSWNFFDLATKTTFAHSVEKPEWITYGYYIDNQIINYYMLPQKGEKRLAVSLVSEGKPILKTPLNHPVRSYSEHPFFVLLLTLDTGQMIFNMRKMIPYYDEIFQDIKPISYPVDYFITRSNNETKIIDHIRNVTFSIGNILIDSVGRSETIAGYVYTLFYKNKAGLYYPGYEKLLPPVYEKVEDAHLADDYLWNVDNNLYSLRTGKFIFPGDKSPSLSKISDHCAFYHAGNSGKNYLYDVSKDSLIETGYTLTRELNHNLFVVSKSGLEGVYNQPNGKLVCNYAYDEIQSAGYGYYYATLKEKRGLLDSSFKAVLPPLYDEIEFHEYDTLIYVHAKLNNKYGILSTTGKTIMPFEFSFFDNYYHPRLILTGKEQKDKKGKTVTLYGLYDLKGKALIPCIYDEITVVNDADMLANVRKGLKWYQVFQNNPKRLVEIKE